MKWFLEDASGTEYEIEALDWGIQKYASLHSFSPNTASIQVPRRALAQAGQWIRAIENGNTQFLGYVASQPSISGDKKIISAKGVEALLWACPCPLQTYWAKVVNLSQVLGHADPDTSSSLYDTPGLIFAANSLIPPGWLEDTLPAETTDPWIAHGPGQIVDVDNAIVKYPHMGTRSRVGSAAIFVNGYPYVEKASYALMAAGDAAVYRNADDLYVRHWLSSAPIPGWRSLPVFAKNAFDTRCRFGGIETDSALSIQLLTDFSSTVGEMLYNLARSVNQYFRIVYIGKLCYIYVVEDFTDLRSQTIAAEFCDKIEYVQPDSAAPSAVTGYGTGGNKTLQQQSIFYTEPGGAFVRSVADFPNTFFCKNQTLKRFYIDGYTKYLADFTPSVHSGGLFSRTLADWREKKEVDSVKICIPATDIKLGSEVNFEDNDKIVSYVVEEIKQSPTSSEITLGREIKTINDAIESVRDLKSAYTTTKDDFNIVAELSSSINMADLSYVASPYPTYHDTHYITTWSRWLNTSVWGFPASNAPPIMSYGYEYYRDHNIRLLLNLKCTPYGSKTPFSNGKCYLYIYNLYTLDGSVYYINSESRIKFDILTDEITDWDVTKYIPFGSSTNEFALHFVLYSTDLIRCYYTNTPYPYITYDSFVLANVTLKLVEQGYSGRKKSIRPTGKCGLTIY